MLKIIEGQFGNYRTHPNGYIKTRTDFWLLKSSKFGMRVLFTSIKCNFFQKIAFYTNFQKVAFYTNQTLFLGWLFSRHDFWTEKVETNGHLVWQQMHVPAMLSCDCLDTSLSLSLSL